MKYIVDRIEGSVVICETLDKLKKNFPIQSLFPDIQEGDHFELMDGKCVFLQEDTRIARNKNIMLQRSLFEE